MSIESYRGAAPFRPAVLAFPVYIALGLDALFVQAPRGHTRLQVYGVLALANFLAVVYLRHGVRLRRAFVRASIVEAIDIAHWAHGNVAQRASAASELAAIEADLRATHALSDAAFVAGLKRSTQRAEARDTEHAGFIREGAG